MSDGEQRLRMRWSLLDVLEKVHDEAWIKTNPNMLILSPYLHTEKGRIIIEAR